MTYFTAITQTAYCTVIFASLHFIALPTFHVQCISMVHLDESTGQESERSSQGKKSSSRSAKSGESNDHSPRSQISHAQLSLDLEALPKGWSVCQTVVNYLISCFAAGVKYIRMKFHNDIFIDL